MSAVMAGRYTAQTDESFVVFLIGMRVNRIRAINIWLPTFRAMRPMLQTLYRYPEHGFLGGQTFMTWRGIVQIQYWRSFEQLERFARSPSEPHLRAWQRFNSAVGGNGSVGIWHETYLVEPGQYEALYGNMPVYGLAAATKHVAVSGWNGTARQRMPGVAPAGEQAVGATS